MASIRRSSAFMPARQNETLWFDTLVQSTGRGSIDPSRRITGTSRLVKDDSMHNSTRRQEATEHMSESTNKIVGSWVDSHVQHAFKPRTSGIISNRAYTVELHHQRLFSEGGVKPFMRPESIDGVISEFDSTKNPFYNRLRGSKDTFNYVEPEPPLHWKPQTAKPSRPSSFVNSTMSPQDRIKAIDWRCFGHRNHLSTPSSQPFDIQHGVPRDWTRTQRAIMENGGELPETSGVKTLAQYTLEKKARAGASLSFAASRQLDGLFVGVEPEQALVSPGMAGSKTASALSGACSAQLPGQAEAGTSIEKARQKTRLPKHFYLGRPLISRMVPGAASPQLYRYSTVDREGAGFDFSYPTPPPTAGFYQRKE